MIVLTSLAWSALGAALALLLPTPIAIIPAFVLPYLLTAFPDSLNNPVYRQMFGQAWGGCCTISSDISTVFLHASMITLGALTLAALLAYCSIGVSRQMFFRITSMITLLGGLALGYYVGLSGNYSQAQPRRQEDLTCTPSWCLWNDTPPAHQAANLQVRADLGLANIFLTADETDGTTGNLRYLDTTDTTAIKENFLTEKFQSDVLASLHRYQQDLSPAELDLVSYALNDIAFLQPADRENLVLNSAGHYSYSVENSTALLDLSTKILQTTGTWEYVAQ